MNFTKETQITQSTTREEKTINDDLGLDELNSSGSEEEAEQPHIGPFEKSFYKNSSGQTILRHSHKAFRINRSQQDLALFCLSLLQFQAEFPLRFYFIQVTQTNPQNKTTGIPMKDIWLQTQFLLSETTIQQLPKNEQVQKKELTLQNKVQKFFSQFLIPLISKFKQQKMCWRYMTSQEYTDEKVINEFNQTIVKKVNRQFKNYCKFY